MRVADLAGDFRKMAGSSKFTRLTRGSDIELTRLISLHVADWGLIKGNGQTRWTILLDPT